MKTYWKTSAKGIALIQKFEGYSDVIYNCPSGVRTIGYGHTGSDVSTLFQQSQRILDKAERQNFFKDVLIKDIEEFEKIVMKKIYVERLMVYPQINQNMFDVLVSFTFNCGEGNLTKLLNGRDKMTVATKMLEYVNGSTGKLEGLVTRRKEEKKLFITTKHSDTKFNTLYNNVVKEYGKDFLTSTHYVDVVIKAIEEGYDYKKFLTYAEKR